MQTTCTHADCKRGAVSIKAATLVTSHGLMQYYDGNLTGNIAGNWPPPYFWWEFGAAAGALIDYWFYTGDAGFNDVVTQAMLHQVGDDNAFMPQNQTSTEVCFASLAQYLAAPLANTQCP